MKNIFISFIFIISLVNMLGAEERESIKIGVLSLRGPTHSLEQWQPTAEYLTRTISSYEFSIIPVTFDDIDLLVSNGRIDFLISNPYIYSLHYRKNQLSAIATMVKKQLDYSNATFGGVVFYKKGFSFEAEKIKTMKIAAVHEKSFGGWLAQAFELAEKNIAIDPDDVAFMNTHDAVVYSVLNNESEVGFVRTGILEAMASEGLIVLDDYLVWHDHGGDKNHLPYLHSTREYPEWPFSVLSHVDPNVARQVAVALYDLPGDSKAAKQAGIQEWTIPLNYSVIESMQASISQGGALETRIWTDRFLLFPPIFVILGLLVLALYQKQRNSYYKNIYGIISPGVAIYRPVDKGRDFIIKSINPSGLAMCHRDKSIFGKSALEEFPYLDEMGLVHSLQKCYRTGEEQYLPVRDYQESDFVLWAENRLFKMKTGDIVVIFDDRSAYHELQEKMKQVEKMDTMGKLAGGIAHDFNNILSGIMGYTELSLNLVEEDTSLTDYLENIKRAGFRAEKLVRQILSFSRQRGKEQTVFNINDIVLEVLDLLEASFPSSIDIKRKMDSNLMLIEGDAGRVHEALVNLLVNGKDAMGDKGILEIQTSMVKMEVETDGFLGPITPGNYVKISVKDKGEGIKPSLLKEIFEPFYSTKPEGKGTGLGLAVVYSVMKEHRGNLMVDSRVSFGTVFSLLFPVTKKELPLSIIKKTEKPSGNLDILLIDDEIEILDVIKKSYEDCHNRVEIYSNGEEALQHFREEPDRFDIVIVDYQLPTLSGIDIAKKIKAITPHIPIFLITGSPESLDYEEWKMAGIVEIVEKPIHQEQLYEILNNIEKD